MHANKFYIICMRKLPSLWALLGLSHAPITRVSCTQKSIFVCQNHKFSFLFWRAIYTHFHETGISDTAYFIRQRSSYTRLADRWQPWFVVHKCVFLCLKPLLAYLKWQCCQLFLVSVRLVMCISKTPIKYYNFHGQLSTTVCSPPGCQTHTQRFMESFRCLNISFYNLGFITHFLKYIIMLDV